MFIFIYVHSAVGPTVQTPNSKRANPNAFLFIYLFYIYIYFFSFWFKRDRTYQLVGYSYFCRYLQNNLILERELQVLEAWTSNFNYIPCIFSTKKKLYIYIYIYIKGLTIGYLLRKCLIVVFKYCCSKWCENCGLKSAMKILV